MKFEDFEALVEAYGASSERWPDSKRADMQRIILAHPEQASAVINAARNLDNMLDVVPPVQASDLLKTRIQIMRPEAANTTHSQKSRRRSSTWARLAAMISVSFSAGFAGAQFVELPQGGETAPIEFVASVDATESDEWAVAATELGFTEIYEWTSGEEIDVSVSDL